MTNVRSDSAEARASACRRAGGLAAAVASVTLLCFLGSAYATSTTAAVVSAPVTLDAGNTLTGLACPSASQCTAVDEAGQQVTFDPAAPGAPSPTTIDAGNALTGVACPSPRRCGAVDEAGQETTFDPTAPAGAV